MVRLLNGKREGREGIRGGLVPDGEGGNGSERRGRGGKNHKGVRSYLMSSRGNGKKSRRRIRGEKRREAMVKEEKSPEKA